MRASVDDDNKRVNGAMGFTCAGVFSFLFFFGLLEELT